jgi:aspartate kinase
VPETDLVRARRTAEAVVAELGARDFTVDDSIAKVSLVGAGMKTHPGVAAQMFRALSDAGVNIDLISTSPIRITCVVDGHQVRAAVRALHESFGLENAEIVVEEIPGCGEGDR